MQLVVCSIALFLFVFTTNVKAQIAKKMNQSKDNEPDHQLQTSQLYEKPDWKVIDVDFLSSYYVQDGNHSPVTGGIGTEYLTDFTQKIIVSAPLSAKTTLLMDAGYDYYTSASTDNINNIPSSASSKDMRVHGNIGMNYMVNDNHSIGVRVGGSGEYDYNSIQGGAKLSMDLRRSKYSYRFISTSIYRSMDTVLSC